ncbi:hypothetical protein M9Y10_034537 [Tritrichomonas musculus]|uniref:Roadblock/LAMTOR2 domain-containing protein n=1 Tax=Tritrichomonas musculus TaxID=1915356 RepID=A0ABR2KFR3_9EUKA
MEKSEDPCDFLDKICESITGVKKGYISDSQGAILAESRSDESSATNDNDDLVRRIPRYFERLSKLNFGEARSMVVEGDDCSFVFLVASPLFLTFICDENANFSLLTELPNEMSDFLSHFQISDS